MLIVISPAKTLDYETPPTTQNYTQPVYLDQSAILIEQLSAMTDAQIASLMKLSDKLAGLNLARYQAWRQPFTQDNAKQAVLAFKGDVYTGLDAETLSDDSLQFTQRHLRILSGLYGILKPLDLMQPYRLEMGTKLANERGKDLYQFWGGQLREALEAELAEHDGVLINLASNEYFKVLQEKQLNATVVTPVFKDLKNGHYKIISFYAKKARGLMTRFIIDEQITEPEAIKGFDREGYRYSEDMSQNNHWVFIRDHQQ